MFDFNFKDLAYFILFYYFWSRLRRIEDLYNDTVTENKKHREKIDEQEREIRALKA